VLLWKEQNIAQRKVLARLQLARVYADFPRKGGLKVLAGGNSLLSYAVWIAKSGVVCCWRLRLIAVCHLILLCGLLLKRSADQTRLLQLVSKRASCPAIGALHKTCCRCAFVCAL
jgi:hypothetical protein